MHQTIERKKHSTRRTRTALFVLLAAILAFSACSPDTALDPAGPDDTSGGNGQALSSVMDLDLRLTARQPGHVSGPALAVARDDTTSDSTNLYIDVEILNLGPDVVYVPSEANDLVLRVRISFVDFPLRKAFDHGRLDIVIGQTETGYQATEKLDFDFAADTTLTFELPISRVDSFRVADNVVVYGTVLSEDRYIIANEVRVFRTSSVPASFPAPDLTGYVRSADSRAGRLFVSNATVVITDSTRVLSPEGNYLGLEMLETGGNPLTVTALAWGYDMLNNMIANGWEFRHYELFVARPINP